MGVEILHGTERAERPVRRSLLRGLLRRCPNCGVGSIFARYLKTRSACDSCGEPLLHHRADDAPPYFTIVLVGHIVVPLALSVEMAYRPPMWLHMALWLPATVILSLLLLERIKGAVVALQWALKMHGFGPPGAEDQIEETPPSG